jgi:hypothetical protein
MEGESFVPLLGNPDAPGRRAFLLEYWKYYPENFPGYTGVRTGTHKYIEYENAWKPELFDLRNDPEERNNLYGTTRGRPAPARPEGNAGNLEKNFLKRGSHGRAKKRPWYPRRSERQGDFVGGDTGGWEPRASGGLGASRGRPGALIPVLKDVQDVTRYLPTPLQKGIAKGLNLSYSEVYGVVTFYSFFNTNPPGRHEIKVCMGTACYVRGNKDLADTLTGTWTATWAGPRKTKGSAWKGSAAWDAAGSRR